MKILIYYTMYITCFILFGFVFFINPNKILASSDAKFCNSGVLECNCWQVGPDCAQSQNGSGSCSCSGAPDCTASASCPNLTKWCQFTGTWIAEAEDCTDPGTCKPVQQVDCGSVGKYGTCPDGNPLVCDNCGGVDCPARDSGGTPTDPGGGGGACVRGSCSCGTGCGGSELANCVCGMDANGQCGMACCTPDQGNCPGGGGGGGPASECMGVPRGSAGISCCSLECRGSVSCIWNVNTNDWLCDDPGWYCAGGGSPNNWSACTGACGAGTQTNDCGTTQSCCIECGPRWSACSATTFNQVGTYDCSASITRNCYASITGTLFDATEVTDCSQMALAPKIPGGRVTAYTTTNSPATSYTSSASNGSGAYTISNMRVPDDYSLDTDMTGVDPALGKYLSVPRFICQSSTASFTDHQQTAVRDFGFWKVYDGWFQVAGGGVRAEGANTPAVQSKIPPTCTAANDCVPYLMRKDAASTVGSAGYVVTGESGTANGSVVTAYSGGDLSKTNEEGNQVYAYAKRQGFKENFDYFTNKLYSMGVSPQSDFSQAQMDDLAKPTQAPVNSGRKAYYANGNVSIQSPWAVSNTESIIILVKGNVTISNTITVAQGGFLAIIASGDITIDPSVGTLTYDSETPQVEGMFIADGIFTVDSSTVGNNRVSDKKFVGAGTFVGWSGVSLKRDYRDTATPDLGLNNNTRPAELFVARPDFAVSAPTEMRRPTYGWEEIAP